MTKHSGAGPPRRRWSVAIAVAGLAAVAGTAVLSCDRQSPSRPDVCATSPTKHTGVTSPAATASAGGGLRVVEKGFTQIGTPGSTVSLGVVLENTGTLVACRTRIRFRVFDAKRQSAVPPKSGEFLYQEIPVILPGQRFGVGAWTYVRDDPFARYVTVVGFEVDLGASQWWPRDNDVHTFAAISTHHQRTDRSSVEPESGAVYYSVESAYCRALASRGVATIFRNGNGALVGGSFSLDKTLQRCLPGKSTEVSPAFGSIPPGIDDSKTESYPYCDPAPPRADPTSTDRPIN